MSLILSGSPRSAPAERQYEEAVASASRERGVHLLTVPHLYFLRPDGSHARRLQELRGRALVASWMDPRPAYWTLRSLGVPPRTHLICRNLADFCCPEVAAEDLACLAARRCRTEANPRHGRIEDLSGPIDSRWYPVLDYSRCNHCGQCLEFCLFGVFSRADGRVVASHPGKCKPGCPACARVCPQGAIMFPHYETDPAIAGVPGAGSPTGEIDVDEFFGDMDRADISPELRAAAVREAACGCDCDCYEMPDGSLLCATAPADARTDGGGCSAECECECPGDGDDELDDLIGALQDLDD